MPAIIFETLHSGTSIATGEPLERQLHWWPELFLSLSMSSILLLLLLLLLLLSKCNNSEKVPATEYDMTAIGPPPSLILLLAGLGLVMWGVLWSAVTIIIISLPTFRNVQPVPFSFLLEGAAVGVQTRRRRMKKGAPRAVVNNKEYPQCNRVAKLCDGLL